MITFLYIVLILSLFAPIYTYAVYPLLLKLMAGFAKKDYTVDESYCPTVSILVAAYNEEKVIAAKILNFSQLDYPAEKIEFLIGSDGSTDRTVEIAKSYSHLKNLKVLDLSRGGKVKALNVLLKEAQGEVLVFSDANTIYDCKAILNLVKYFTDDRIGCVSGQLRYKVDESSGLGAKSESAYWKYENWVKVLESKLGGLSGANGAIYAIRKGLIKEVRNDIINDDFYMATSVLQLGYDVILETGAIAYEEPNDELQSQFKRHVRDGAGHYQAIAVFWRMLFPRKGSFVFVSHRMIRWLTPFFLIVAFIFNAMLVSQSVFTAILFILQTVGYLLMSIYYLATKKGMVGKEGIIGKLLNITFYFFLVNSALLLGFARLISKRQKTTWETQR
jgi:biofilm PGA synthesis N-glycosyltransferase PgaC